MEKLSPHKKEGLREDFSFTFHQTSTFIKILKIKLYLIAILVFAGN
jgi:hypothetical protein